MRVSPPRITPDVARAARPPDGPGRETHRQSGFVLGDDLDAVVEGLRVEGATSALARAPKARTPTAAALLALWSRSWLMRLNALHATETGNYAAAFPGVRAAAELDAAARLLPSDGAEEWAAWLESSFQRVSGLGALEIPLHPFRGAEIMAGDGELGTIFRAATDLSMAHFGASILLAGDSSDSSRVAVTFGDRDFHYALAEIILGWLLSLSAGWLRSLAGGDALPTPDDETATAFLRTAEGLITRSGRARVEVIEHGGSSRYLVHNWRRAPGGAPGRLLV